MQTREAGSRMPTPQQRRSLAQLSTAARASGETLTSF